MSRGGCQIHTHWAFFNGLEISTCFPCEDELNLSAPLCWMLFVVWGLGLSYSCWTEMTSQGANRKSDKRKGWMSEMRNGMRVAEMDGGG